VTYGIEPGTGSALLLGWLVAPYDPEKTIAALLGLSAHVTRQLLGTVLATSDEAEHLLATMPTVVRSLAIATTDRAERCYGEIRGPVLWAETLSARSASAADPGLYVCATTTRAYDTDENRVLVAALEVVRAAGNHAEPGFDDAGGNVARRARHNAHQAARFLDHQALALVPTTRPNPRALRRTRAGSRRHTYRPALALLRRAAAPLGPSLVNAVADSRTRAQHDLLAAVLLRLEAVTGVATKLRHDAGELTSGPVRFHHPGHHGAVGASDGIQIGDVLIDVPDPLGADPTLARVLLDQRVAVGGRGVLALSGEDVDHAVAMALG